MNLVWTDLDEMFITINKERHYLWRAMQQDGNVLDILVQRRRNKQAAKPFFRKLLKGLTYVPRVIITEKLKSDGAAKREILPGVEHRQHRSLNNHAKNFHQPTRQRERCMQGLKSPGHAQGFLFAYGPIAHHFRPRRHRFSASAYRQEMQQGCQVWGADHGHGDSGLRAAAVRSWCIRALLLPQDKISINKLSTLIFGNEVLIAQQQFLIDRPRYIRQQVFPVHRLHLSLCHP